jgi:hypothetical protein
MHALLATLTATCRKEDVGENTEYGDSAYVFDMSPRPDVDHLGKPLKPQQQQQQLQQQQQQQDTGPRSVGLVMLVCM